MLLYYITDRTQFPGDEFHRRSSLLEKIAQAAQFGVDYVQLREKDLGDRDLETLARQAIATIARSRVTTQNRRSRTILLLNSRVDVALAVGAAGIHLRSDDISPSEVRKIWNHCGAGASVHEEARTGMTIAVSCHLPEEIEIAAEGNSDFAVFGPVFEKRDSPDSRPIGLEGLRKACRHKIPVLALGGITLENACKCFEAGAAGVAAIRLFQDNDLGQVISKLGQ